MGMSLRLPCDQVSCIRRTRTRPRLRDRLHALPPANTRRALAQLLHPRCSLLLLLHCYILLTARFSCPKSARPLASAFAQPWRVSSYLATSLSTRAEPPLSGIIPPPSSRCSTLSCVLNDSSRYFLQRVYMMVYSLLEIPG